MIFGVDFDNTIVCYDAIFHRVAVERGLVPPEVPATKTAVRDFLRRSGMEAAWTEMQGYVYGPGLMEAEMFPEVQEFFRACKAHGVTVKIISHKTRHPYRGEPHDLHAATRSWLELNGFFSADDVGLREDAVFLELTKEAKFARIAAERCTHFIDDLPEFLADPAFPPGVRRVLFDPADVSADAIEQTRVRSWAEATERIFAPQKKVAVEVGIGLAARALFSSLGMKLAMPPARLAGGGNNRIYEAKNEDGNRFLLKEYFTNESHERNRLESERLFYRLAALAVPTQVPRALAWDPATQLGLFEFVDGQKLATTEIGDDEVKGALGFFTALNRDRTLPEARVLPVAAEACFNFEEHCLTVERRMKRLRGLSVQSEIDQEARDFAANELTPVWEEVREAILAQAGGEAGRVVERCVSPSDFGFHNSLRRTDGRLVFLDFEYSGWDDPAKMVCDFFCQPALPVPADAFSSFAQGTAQALKLERLEPFLERCRTLLPLYRLKWCGIMLNEFLAEDQRRRTFALGADGLEQRKARRFCAARHCLALIRRTPHGTTA